MSKKIQRTSSGLREALFDELDALRAGTSDPTKVAAVANIARQIINSVRIDLDYHRLLRDVEEAKNFEPLSRPIPLTGK